MVLAAPNTCTMRNRFRAQMYILSRTESKDARVKPIRNGYIHQLWTPTWDQLTRIDLPPGVEMVMPGEHCEVFITMFRPMVVEMHMRFTFHEGERVVATGVVTRLLENFAVDSAPALGKMKTEQLNFEPDTKAL